jgi:hypothetical protein
MKLAAKFLTVAALMLFSVVTAKADSGQTVNYTLTGANTASFTVSMNSTPEFSGNNYYFTTNPINLIVDGTSESDTLVFFSSADLGGLNSVFSSLPDLAGFQLYSGSESDPTLLTGVFKLWDLDGTGWYTLTATAAGVPAPEPSVVLMLVSGLFAVGLGFKRRLTNQTEVN